MKRFKIATLSILLGLMGSLTFAQDNFLTEQEQADGWELLFDGTFGSMSANWKTYIENDPFPDEDELSDAWIVKDDNVMYLTNGNDRDIRSKRKYGDIVWKMDYRVNGNQGVFYKGTLCKDEFWKNAIEYAIDPNTSNAEIYSGAVYDIYATPLFNAIDMNDPNAWNEFMVITINDSVEQYHNGIKTASFRYWSPDWNDAFGNSKFSNGYDAFGLECINNNPQSNSYVQDGYLGFQATHGGKWEIKNNKILNNAVIGCTDPNREGYFPEANYDVNAPEIGSEVIGTHCGQYVGCMTVGDPNHDPLATLHDESKCGGTPIGGAYYDYGLASKFTLQPGPGILTIESDYSDEYKTILMDVKGKQIYSNIRNGSAQWSITDLNSGLLFVYISSKGIQFTEKIMIQ